MKEVDIETIFDIVPGLHASILDKVELENICKDQQVITMNRIASWLRNYARMFELEWQTGYANELKALAIELVMLSQMAESNKV